ncbi:MAG: molybdopterin-dependent oxidoreductase [Pseudomonadales bacterium]
MKNETKSTICRVCHALCPMHVEMENGVPIKVSGVKDHPVYNGFMCAKGRQIIDLMSDDTRLQSSMKRDGDGHSAISSDQAMDEIAEKIERIVAEHGPESVAIYIGTHGFNNQQTTVLSKALMAALNSPMIFTSVSIDQPGKFVSLTLHGAWLAGSPGLEEVDVWLSLGANPIVSMLGPVAPANGFTVAKKRGMKILTVDPRKSELAKRADIHLPAKPGMDSAILACLIKQIIDQNWVDESFIRDNVDGLQELTAAVAPFDVDTVAELADVDADALRELAKCYASARRGIATLGTGPNMAGHGNLSEYLALSLMSICGHWRQVGDTVPNTGVLVHSNAAIGAAVPPGEAWGFGKSLRVRGLGENVTGMPTAALAEEILLPGKGQIKALINIGGNPMLAWPDQLRTHEALEELELLVSIDPYMGATSKMSDYVIAPTLFLEQSSNSVLQDSLSGIPGWGFTQPYGQYCEPLVSPPEGSDVIDDWSFFYGLGQRLGLPLRVPSIAYLDPTMAIENGSDLDMQQASSSEELWTLMLKDAPVPYERVKQQADGELFPERTAVVSPKPDDHIGRLNVGNTTMMSELVQVGNSIKEKTPEWPFRMVSRRLYDMHNSSMFRNAPLRERYPYNPAYMNPEDMLENSLKDGDTIRIESNRSHITGIVETASELRRGVISMSHAWGTAPGDDTDPFVEGSNIGRLTNNTENFDPYTGIPRMSNIPVKISPLAGS